MRSLIGFNRRGLPTNVRVSLDDGSQLGVMPIREAFRISDERGLDLVCINSNAEPPICKITDYGKFKYQQKQKEKENKRKQVVVETKEIKLRPKIDKHDLDIKVRQMTEFLSSGNRVKISLSFRGRENAHPEIGFDVINYVLEQLKTFSVVEFKPTMEGKTITTILNPVKKVQNANLGKGGTAVERSDERPSADQGRA